MNLFRCSIITPEGTSFDNNVWRIGTSSTDGYFSILAHHEPFFATLPAESGLEIYFSQDNKREFKIGSGLLEFKNNECKIICEYSQKK